jgi:hypothetical protein
MQHLLRETATAVTLVLGLILASSSTAASLSREAEQEVSNHLPGLAISNHRHVDVTGGSFRLTRFEYQTARVNNKPYGTGLAFWSLESGALTWLYLHSGDFPPHSMHWADFDGDGRDDLFFLSGLDDVTETHILLNRVAVDGFAITNFGPGLAFRDAYAIVLDLDADGLPELLLPDKGPPMLEESEATTLTSWVNKHDGVTVKAAEQEYHRLIGRFDELNRGSSALHKLYLFDKIRIITLHEKTAAFEKRLAAHIEWRKEMLQRLRPLVPVADRQRIDDVLKHLDVRSRYICNR